MRVPRLGDSEFASHLEDHKLLYVSLEILLLTTSRRSRGLGWLSIFGRTSHELVRVDPDRAEYI